MREWLLSYIDEEHEVRNKILGYALLAATLAATPVIFDNETPLRPEQVASGSVSDGLPDRKLALGVAPGEDVKILKISLNKIGCFGEETGGRLNEQNEEYGSYTAASVEMFEKSHMEPNKANGIYDASTKEALLRAVKFVVTNCKPVQSVPFTTPSTNPSQSPVVPKIHVNKAEDQKPERKSEYDNGGKLTGKYPDLCKPPKKVAIPPLPKGAKKYRSKSTVYYPEDVNSSSERQMEGGMMDRAGGSLKNHSLQDFVEGKRGKGGKYVAVAMDKSAFGYGTKLRIPEIEEMCGREIQFRVVDTGGAFVGKGKGRIDIMIRNRSKNGPLGGLYPLTLVKVP